MGDGVRGGVSWRPKGGGGRERREGPQWARATAAKCDSCFEKWRDLPRHSPQLEAAPRAQSRRRRRRRRPPIEASPPAVASARSGVPRRSDAPRRSERPTKPVRTRRVRTRRHPPRGRHDRPHLRGWSPRRRAGGGYAPGRPVRVRSLEVSSCPKVRAPEKKKEDTHFSHMWAPALTLWFPISQH